MWFSRPSTDDACQYDYADDSAFGSGDGVFGIAADADGSAFVTGAISASWDPGTFPFGFQPKPGFGGVDAWVAKLRPDGSNLEWFSCLWGQVKIAPMTGITSSFDFPARDAPQSKAAGGQDAFVAKISANGQQLA